MAEVPVIQILDRKNYFKQALVPLPDALPLPPLAESSIRMRTEVMCLTTNNFSYCQFGHLFGWWDVHPIPPSTPAPYNDTSILDSTFAGVPKGSYVWGYLPIGTLPQDLHVKAGDIPGLVIVTDEFRQKQMRVYNRYTVYPESLGREIEARSDAVAYDALVRVMHMTGYLMARYLPTSAAPPWSSAAAGLDVVWVNASDMLMSAIEQNGERGFADEYEAAWRKYRDAGIKGFRVVWGEGIEDVKKGWDRFARNEVKADEGLAFKV
ncbi:hypothetical protein GGR52DRAFT_576563 [Hypoxylon sp. FL1284]|nr:hypothetical protein GGR52DRAFT_576563 [Hypoxylon sp. FL1284]